jgi:dephospho-CoA kinase
MKIIGLTGSIGMGKTTAAGQIRRLGYPVYDADAVVHELMEKGGKAVAAVARVFPSVVVRGAVDRAALGAIVHANEKQLKRLEKILHPLVGTERKHWLAARKKEGHKLVVLDIPLLFEVGWDKHCDAVMVVSAPALVQRERVLKRKGMTPAKLKSILARQMPDREKRQRADVVIDTGKGRAHSLRQIKAALKTWAGDMG